MRFLFFFIVFFVSLSPALPALQHAFVIQDVDTNQILVSEGDVHACRSPYCSFNVALSLIGFDAKVLETVEAPLWPFERAYEAEYLTSNASFPEKWKSAHTPSTWMKNSCLWYSQSLARNLNMKMLGDYLKAFGYGNQNIEGDANKSNGLTNAWIGSSLRISPLEQVRFINLLVKEELPVSTQAFKCTKSILFLEELPNGMRLYGKTGGGDYGNGREAPPLKVGWFVGFVEKGNKRLSFAYLVQGNEVNGLVPGIVAKEHAKQKLQQLQL